MWAWRLGLVRATGEKEDEIELELARSRLGGLIREAIRLTTLGCVCSLRIFQIRQLRRVDRTPRLVAISSSYSKSTIDHIVQSSWLKAHGPSRWLEPKHWSSSCVPKKVVSSPCSDTWPKSYTRFHITHMNTDTVSGFHMNLRTLSAQQVGSFGRSASQYPFTTCVSGSTTWR